METVAEVSEEPPHQQQHHQEDTEDHAEDDEAEEEADCEQNGDGAENEMKEADVQAATSAASPTAGESSQPVVDGGGSKDASGSGEGPARLFRSGKGPAEQAYDLFLKELAQWKEAKEEAAAQKRQQRGGAAGAKGGRKGGAARLVSLDVDSSGSETDLEDVDDPARESWAGLVRGLEKLYDRACATYQVTALTQFKFQLTTKQLSITNMSLRHRDVQAMCIPLGHKDDLEHIVLSGNLIGCKGLSSLLSVTKEYRNLISLDLSHNSLGSDAAELLATNVDSLRALRTLNVAGNRFLERDAEHIASIITQLETLRTLNASGNTFGSHGGEFIGFALKTNANLENLNLSGCEIRMQGAVAIGMALKDNGSLDNLDVSYNGFSDLGAKALSEALKVNNALTVLNLTCNRIFIDGARAIGSMLAVNETLKKLYLDKNSFTCDGAQEIMAKLKENESSALETLDMKNVSITYKTAAAVLPTVQQPLLVRFESFVVEPGGLREQLGIPAGSGGCVPLTQKLQAEAAHVLRVFTASQRINLVRLAREAGRGAPAEVGDGDGLTESEMRRLLLSLPIGLQNSEVDSLIDSLRGQPDDAGNFTFTLNSLLTLGEPQLAKMEAQH